MRLFDAHCHLTDPRFDADRDAAIARMREAGVERCVLIADPREEIPNEEAALALARREPGFRMAIGVHPHNASGFDERAEETVRRFLREPECVALGEIGLDYHYDLSPRDAQREVFARQLDMAYELSVPCQLHIREAFGDFMDILAQARATGRLPVCVMHCYSGSWETAKQCLSMGMYISFSGSVTFKNGKKLEETAIRTPVDRLLIETDSPYLAPEPMRGRRNEPAFVSFTASKIAELRGMDERELSQAAFDNASRLFFRARAE